MKFLSQIETSVEKKVQGRTRNGFIFMNQIASAICLLTKWLGDLSPSQLTTGKLHLSFHISFY